MHYFYNTMGSLATKSSSQESSKFSNLGTQPSNHQIPNPSPLGPGYSRRVEKETSKTCHQETPMMVEILTEMIEDVVKNPTLSNIHLEAACLLTYSGFLRVDELISLGPCDINLSQF